MPPVTAYYYCSKLDARSPTKEEWEVFAQTLGKNTPRGYNPDLIPGTRGYTFGVSSSDHTSSFSGYYFDGTYGTFEQNFFPVYDRAVRCVR